MHPLRVMLLLAAVAASASIGYVLVNGIDRTYRLEAAGSIVSLDGQAVLVISIMIIVGAIAVFTLGGERRP